MISMIVLYIKIFRVLHGQMSKLLVWLTEVKLNNGRRTSQTIDFDLLTGTGNETCGVRGPVSTASSTSNFHQQTARCSTIGSMNNINYIHHHHARIANTYPNVRTIKSVSTIDTNKFRLSQQQDLLVTNEPTTTTTAATTVRNTKNKFRRAAHAIVGWDVRVNQLELIKVHLKNTEKILKRVRIKNFSIRLLGLQQRMQIIIHCVVHVIQHIDVLYRRLTRFFNDKLVLHVGNNSRKCVLPNNVELHVH